MRVLVVGTNRACHRRLSGNGHRLVLMIARSKAKTEDLAGPYRHVIVLDDHAHIELWVDAARCLHRHAAFDAVVAYNEDAYVIVAAISARLGIPCTIDAELFLRVLDKHRMRQILGNHDIPSCRYAFVRGREALLEAIQNVGTPCIVKPVDGEASRGVAKIDSPADVERALRCVGVDDLGRGVLVEEFLVGEELSVEAISTRGRHHVVAITKKFKDDQSFVESGHLVPAPLDPSARAAIESYVAGILEAFGFHDCPSHTELMLTSQGPRIIETHNRIGGDRIMDLVQHATGVDMYDLVARQSVGGDITPLLPDVVRHHQSAAVWYASPSLPPTQKLLEVRGVAEARTLPFVKTLDLLKEPGSRPAWVRASSDRTALVVVVAKTPGEAVTRARQTIEALSFIYSWAPSA